MFAIPTPPTAAPGLAGVDAEVGIGVVAFTMLARAEVDKGWPCDEIPEIGTVGRGFLVVDAEPDAERTWPLVFKAAVFLSGEEFGDGFAEFVGDPPGDETPEAGDVVLEEEEDALGEEMTPGVCT